MRMHPERVCAIAGACAILHNIVIIRNEPIIDDEFDECDDTPEMEPYNVPERGLLIRTHICNTFFA
jgi:hypothetical protein